MQFLRNILDYFAPYTHYITAFLICAAGAALATGLSRLIRRVLEQRTTPQVASAVGKTVGTLLGLIVFFTALAHLRINLTALLGAAGIAGVAVGFAAQTSLSNLICGLFIVLERPFKIGDMVEVEGSLGLVDRISMLSTYLRVFDNRLIRIPNETIMKAKITNVTAFPIRRADLEISTAYSEDPCRIMRLLRETCDANPDCFDEPEPLVIFRSIGKTSLDFTLCVWIERRSFLRVKNSLLCDIKTCFDREGVVPAFPPVVVHLRHDADQHELENLREPPQ